MGVIGASRMVVGGVAVGVPWTPIPPPSAPADVAANDLTANYNATLASLPIQNSVPAGNLLLPKGAYKIGSLGVDTNDLGPLVNLEGWGQSGLSTLEYYGSAQCILKTNSGGNGGPNYLPSSNTLAWGSALKEFMVDMTNNTGANGLNPAAAVHLSDISGTNTDFTAVDYTWPVGGTATAKSAALAVTHTNYWAEKSHLKFQSFYCSTGLFCDGGSANLSTSGFSMQGTEVDATILVPPGAPPGLSSSPAIFGCMGIHLAHGVWFYNCTVKMQGNAWCDNVLGVSYGFLLERANAGGAFARMDNCHFDVAMEGDGNGTAPGVPYTIWFDNVTKTIMHRGTGVMRWYPGPGGASWGPSTTGVGGVTSATINQCIMAIYGDTIATGLAQESAPWLMAAT